MRDGQQRVEVSPSNFVWMDEKDRKAFADAQEAKQAKPIQSPKRPDVENASMVASERAVLPASQAHAPATQPVAKKAAAKSSPKSK